MTRYNGVRQKKPRFGIHECPRQSISVIPRGFISAFRNGFASVKIFNAIPHCSSRRLWNSAPASVPMIGRIYNP